MGILDNILANPEANSALAAGLLSGNFGAGLMGMNQVRAQQQDAALKKRMVEAQLGEIAAQTQQRQAEADKQRAAMQEAARQQQILRSFGQAPQGLGATDQVNAALPTEMRIGAQPQLATPSRNYQSLIQQGIPPAIVKALAESADYGRPEVARVEETMQGNRPVRQQFDKFGNPVGQALGQWKAPVQVNQGNQHTFVDPVSMQKLGSLQTFQSPDSVASNALGWANNALTRRGQDMTDARARETAAAGKLQYDAERGGVVDLRTNTFTPAMQGGQPVGPKEKPLTDTQAKALQFSSRMVNSHKIMDDLFDKGAVHTIPGSNAGYGIGRTVRAFGGAQNQQLEQAQRDYVNALLRRESGAAISPTEFESAQIQYFPQVGDDAQTIANKKRNREIAIAGLKAEVPRGAPSIEQFMPPSANKPAGKPPVPMKGMVQNGYRFKGGDPADQNNWEKQ